MWAALSGWIERRRTRRQNGFVVLQNYYERHFTPVGKALFLLLILSLSLGMVGSEVLIYMVLSALGCLWLGTLLVGHGSRPRNLAVQVYFPSRLQVGQEALIEVEVENQGIHPCFHLFVELELQTPQHKTSLVNSETEYFCLPPGESRRFQLRWQAQTRGELQCRQISVVSLFPLGLLLWRQMLPRQGRYFVYPRPRFVGAPPWHRLPQQSRGLSPQNSLLQGQSLEFHGLRPWLPGDSPRHIHWPTLARTGELAVREFQQHPGQEIALLLDLCDCPNSETLEATISVCAGVAEQIAGDPINHLVLASMGAELYWPQRGRVDVERIFMHLARLRAEDPQSAPQTLLEPLQEQSDLSLIIWVTSRWGPEQQQVMQQWLRFWQVRVYLVTDQPPAQTEEGLLCFPVQEPSA